MKVWHSIAFASLIAVGRTTLVNGPQSYLANNDDNRFETFKSPINSSHSISIREQNDSLCDAGSKQYTGWLDFHGKHMFFCELAMDTQIGRTTEPKGMLTCIT